MRTTIATILACSALLLTACAGQQHKLEAVPKQISVQAFATLATNVCEQETAGPYTALAASRYRAASKLRSGSMSAQAAQLVQNLSDQARSELDAACVNGKPVAARVARAKVLMSDIRSILER